MLLKQLLNEVVIEVESGDENAEPIVDQSITKHTLEDTFEVGYSGLDYIKKELETLNKKAKRIGVEPLTVVVIKEFDRDVVELNGDRVKKHMFEVKINGKAPMIDGYEFVASIEHASEGNIINMSPQCSVKHLPDKYRSTNNVCDYCHTKRDRLSTFVLKDQQKHDLLQVGRSCLKNFLPSKDPKMILSYAQILENALRAAVGGESMDDYSDGLGGGGRNWSRYYPADYYLFHVCMAYIINGKFISTKASREAYLNDQKPVESTADEAWFFAEKIYHIKDPAITRRWLPIMEQKKPATEKLHEELKKWIDEKDWDAEIEKNQESNPGLAQYFHNIKVIANSSTIARKNSRLHASVLGIYLREKAYADKKAAASAAPKEFLGKVGDKIKFNGILKKVKDMGVGQWGQTWLYSFEDDKGNDIVWFSANSIPYEEGQKVSVVGTVKKQEVSRYTNQPQTQITRAKVGELL